MNNLSKQEQTEARFQYTVNAVKKRNHEYIEITFY